MLFAFGAYASPVFRVHAMTDLKQLVVGHAESLLLFGGLIIGAMFGAIAQRSGFCTLGALSDWTLFGDARRLRSWLLAIAVATVGAQALFAGGIVDLDQSIYRTGALLVGGHIAGGLLFGFGMVLTGGCVSRNLVRAGSGDLRALLVLLVIAVTVAATLGGVLGPARVWFTTATATSPSPGPSAETGLAVALASAVLLGAICFANAAFRRSFTHWGAGAGIGICVVLGWALTGLAFDAFADAPVQAQSLTFVKPVSDAVDWLKRSTALGVPGFAIASVAGTMIGACLAAVMSRTFVLATFADTRDTARHLAGAVLMAVGGVLALGCSVGQGITGIATLAPGSALTLAAIAAGAVAGLKASERYSILT